MEIKATHLNCVSGLGWDTKYLLWGWFFFFEVEFWSRDRLGKHVHMICANTTSTFVTASLSYFLQPESWL